MRVTRIVGRILDLVFAWFQKNCCHEGDHVIPDILSGIGGHWVPRGGRWVSAYEVDNQTHVKWCQRCGAFRVYRYDPQGNVHADRWEEPRADWCGRGEWLGKRRPSRATGAVLGLVLLAVQGCAQQPEVISKDPSVDVTTGTTSIVAPEPDTPDSLPSQVLVSHDKAIRVLLEAIVELEKRVEQLEHELVKGPFATPPETQVPAWIGELELGCATGEVNVGGVCYYPVYSQGSGVIYRKRDGPAGVPSTIEMQEEKAPLPPPPPPPPAAPQESPGAGAAPFFERLGPAQGAYIAASIADALSSWGRPERNRVLAGGDGRFSTRGAGIKAGLTLGVVLAHRYAAGKSQSNSRKLAVINWITAAALTGVAVRNWRMR